MMKKNIVICTAFLLSLASILAFVLMNIGDSKPNAPDFTEGSSITHVNIESNQLNKATKSNGVYSTVSVNCANDIEKFDAYIELQGATSATYPKKSYKISASNGNSFVLKANYTDFTFFRNIVSTRLWNQINRYHLALEGKPVLLYVQNDYRGIYTLNEPKTKDSFFLPSGEEPVAVIGRDQEISETEYTEPIVFGSKGFWSDIYIKTGEEERIKESLYELLRSSTLSDEEFKETVEARADKESLIDYLLFTQYIQALDNGTKNTIWVTYDGVRWYIVPYDLDATYGLQWDGKSIVESQRMLPHYSNDRFESNMGLFWTKFFNVFQASIIERYWELRDNKILSPENIRKLFEEYESAIPEEVYGSEIEMWPKIPSAGLTGLEQISDFLEKRTSHLDKLFSRENTLTGEEWNSYVAELEDKEIFASQEEESNSLERMITRAILWGPLAVFATIAASLGIRELCLDKRYYKSNGKES